MILKMEHQSMQNKLISILNIDIYNSSNAIKINYPKIYH